MKQRVSILGTLAMAAIAAVHPAPVCRVIGSAEKFARCFRDLPRTGIALSPAERFVFSLVLTNAKAGPAESAWDVHSRLNHK
jgi:hypothetical protein